MKKTVSLILAAVLVMSMLLSACTHAGTLKGEIPTAPTNTESPVKPTVEPDNPTESVPPETDPLPDPSDEALIRWQNSGARDYLPDEPVQMVSFSEMKYVRPDTDTLFSEFDALIETAKTSEDTNLLLDGFFHLYDAYIDFYSMDTIANIHKSLDTTDSYYSEEYDWCEAQTPELEEKMERLYKTFAAGPARDALEDAYFGEGFFLDYDELEVYTNEDYLDLAKQEEELLAEYRSLTAEPTVEYEGEEQSFWELMDTQDYKQYMTVLQAYYAKYNPLIGDCYVRLVKVRKQMALVLGYDSYADFAYEYTYDRDYTPEQGRAFLQEIEDEIVPVSENASMSYALMGLSADSGVKESDVKKMLSSAVRNLGGTIQDAYSFMSYYELYDIAQKDEKMDGSFQTYIHSYEAPFVFVNSQGTSADYTTFAHEFGHFTDSYYNYGADEDLETAETFSQAMEFLALTYTDGLSEAKKTRYMQKQLADMIDTFTTQAAFARFEDAVFEIPDDELTVERINDTFFEICQNFGLAEYGFDFYYSQFWIDVLHFFEVPYYVISYCVSGQTALEVYELEAENPGAGVDAYFRLLDRDHEAGVQKVMEDAGLENPFRDGAMEQTARFLREKLGLEE